MAASARLTGAPRFPPVRPVDAVTLDQAARILGVARSTVQGWVLAGRLTSHGGRGEQRQLSQADVEALAAAVYDWREHAEDPESYWLSSRGAAELLGVSRQPGLPQMMGTRFAELLG